MLITNYCLLIPHLPHLFTCAEMLQLNAQFSPKCSVSIGQSESSCLPKIGAIIKQISVIPQGGHREPADERESWVPISFLNMESSQTKAEAGQCSFRSVGQQGWVSQAELGRSRSKRWENEVASLVEGSERIAFGFNTDCAPIIFEQNLRSHKEALSVDSERWGLLIKRFRKEICFKETKD